MNLFLAPMVISQRLPILWLESIGVAPTGRRESERMVTEKVDAISEGLFAAQREIMLATFAMGTAMMAGHSPVAAAIRGTERATQAALAPGERKMRRNFKRLSAKRA